MNKSLLWVAILTAAGAVVSGCASVSSVGSGPRGAPGPLTTPICSPPEVQVSINQVTISGSTATIKVNPGARDFSNKGAGIRWNIAGNKYSFAADGITFDKANYPNQANGPGNSGPGNNATEYLVCFGDTSATAYTWHYNIKFFANDSPSTVWICDPTVVNSASLLNEEQLVNCVIATN